jgi:hypothetical protein
MPISFLESLSSSAGVFMILLYGDEIDLVAPIFQAPNLFGQVPENSHAIGEAYEAGGPLSGALAANVTVGTTTIDFPIFGFGATLLNSTVTKFNSTFNGQGHFFYVAPNGVQYFDYGLEADPPLGVSYSTQVPEFGFSVAHFMSITPLGTITFLDLNLELGTFAAMVSMGRIIQGTSPSVVEGFCAGMCPPPDVVPLTWVTVSAGNTSYSRSTVTVDGQYDGVEALFLPAGIYNVTFSVAWFIPQTQSSFNVDWSDTYSLLPPQGPLCPIAEPSMCPNPSPSPAPSLSLLGFGTNVITEGNIALSNSSALEDRAVSSAIRDLGI